MLIVLSLFVINAKIKLLAQPSLTQSRFELANNAQYYLKTYKFKKNLMLLRKDIYNILPDTIKYFKFNSSDEEKKDINDCTTYINQLRTEYASHCKSSGKVFNEQDFNKYWIERRQSCFIKFKKLYPKIFFEFQNYTKSKTIIISYIKTKIYYKVQYLGPSESGSPYISTENFGEENIVIDVNKLDAIYQLQKTYDFSGYLVFDLQLMFLTSNYRPDINRNSLLINITFNCIIDGKMVDITSKPFFIDL